MKPWNLNKYLMSTDREGTDFFNAAFHWIVYRSDLYVD